MKSLIIIGAGGFAREVYWHAQKAINIDWKIKGFLDGDMKLPVLDYKLLPKDIPILGDIDNYKICSEDVFVCAVGSPAARKKLVEKILVRGGKFKNIISSCAYVMPTAKIGQGAIIAPNVLIGDNVQIGDFVAINAGTIIGHDTQIGKFSCIMPQVNIAGKCRIEDEVFIGSSAIVIPKTEIFQNATIGAGTVVLKKVHSNTKVFGNPALEF